MTQIEGKIYSIQVDGKETLLSFTFELLPNDMKYLALFGGGLSISGSYFSPFADVMKADISNLQGKSRFRASVKFVLTFSELLHSFYFVPQPPGQ